TNQYVHDIPLYNRSIFGLVFLAGGVTETTGSGINDNYPSTRDVSSPICVGGEFATWIHEDMKLQIRAEMFNATNTPRFATPATGWGSEDFGTVTSSRGNSRKMQFGARFQF